ncbi:MAG: hypothetical protein U0Y96_07165 [Candidatus Kapaibacterium sp.]
MKDQTNYFRNFIQTPQYSEMKNKLKYYGSFVCSNSVDGQDNAILVSASRSKRFIKFLPKKIEYTYSFAELNGMIGVLNSMRGDFQKILLPLVCDLRSLTERLYVLYFTLPIYRDDRFNNIYLITPLCNTCIRAYNDIILNECPNGSVAILE